MAIAIMAIIAAIAYPAYQEHVRRGLIVDGTNALAEGRHQMEQFFMGNRTYASGPCVTSRNAGVFTVKCPTTAPGLPDADSYIIEAVGSGALSGLTYTVDENGTQRTTAVPSGWASVPNGGHRCWLQSKGASC